MPSSDPTVVRLSTHDCGRRPARKPSGMPTTVAKRMAVSGQLDGGGEPPGDLVETGCWVIVEVPKSSVRGRSM